MQPPPQTRRGRLRRLDDRVLGRWSGRQQPAAGFVIGVTVCVAVLLLAVHLGRPGFVAGTGGFVGVTVASGLQWWRSAGEARRTVGCCLLLGVLAVAGTGTAAFLTRDGWVREDRVLPQDLFPLEPTLVVQCDATDDGPAYAYQPRVSERLTCLNGAKPRVLFDPREPR